jgi:hypothetical protein
MIPVGLLENLLDQMADALQRGALNELAALSGAIETEIAILPDLDPGRAEGLRRRAARNDLCLQAAARGVRSALARIAGVGRGQQLSTYGADGRKILVGATLASHSQRL